MREKRSYFSQLYICLDFGPENKLRYTDILSSQSRIAELLLIALDIKKSSRFHNVCATNMYKLSATNRYKSNLTERFHNLVQWNVTKYKIIFTEI